MSGNLTQAPSLAVVVPVFDEEESLRPLYTELAAAFASFAGEAEIIFVDDGSSDGSVDVIRELAEKDVRVRLLQLDAHYGQSAALDAGFQAVTAPITATLDADLQNDPRDILRLLPLLDCAEGAGQGQGDGEAADVVNGVRVDRHDRLFKRASSRVANAVRNFVTGESVTDVGCSLRVMRTSYLRRIKLYRGLHRFLPTLLALEGARVVEVPVSHRPRCFGRSKYGTLDRLFTGIVDLFAVLWMKRRAAAYRVTEE